MGCDSNVNTPMKPRYGSKTLQDSNKIYKNKLKFKQSKLEPIKKSNLMEIISDHASESDSNSINYSPTKQNHSITNNKKYSFLKIKKNKKDLDLPKLEENKYVRNNQKRKCQINRNYTYKENESSHKKQILCLNPENKENINSISNNKYMRSSSIKVEWSGNLQKYMDDEVCNVNLEEVKKKLNEE